MSPLLMSGKRHAAPVGAGPAWVVGALLFFAAGLAAQNDLPTLFPLQAPIYVVDANLSRLDLPVEVLSNCAADLSDLRILDFQGNEVAYLLDNGPESNRAVEVVRRHALEIVDVDRSRSDRQEGPSVYRERYVLAVPVEVTAVDIWDLTVQTNRPEFVRRIRVAAGDGSQPALIDDGSLFRLSDAARERTRLTLPRFSAGSLTVEIEGEEGVYLEPVFHLETSSSVAPREQARIILPVISRQEDGRSTVIELERPRGVNVDALVLRTATAAFSRGVEVWDEGPGGSNARQGAKNVYRVQAAAVVEDLEVPVGAVSGNRLRVVIDNGDSPPLAELSFVAGARRPSLLFALTPQGEGLASGRLLFGGGRAFRPQYDLELLRNLLRLPRQGQQAQLATQLYQPSQARLGELTRNPEFGAQPVLSFAMRPGGPVDSRLYTHQRTLRLDPSEEGLSRLTLTIEDLAAAQPDLRDLRIIDEQSRQWAYLTEQGTARSTAALGVAGPETKDGVSEYELGLPARPVTIEEIELHTLAEFFDREFELLAARGGTEFSLFTGRLRRRAGDSRPVAILVDARRIDSLKLKIHDRNDAPLALSRVEASFPVARLYVAAPAGEYTLLLGNAEDQPPSYELARVSTAVLAVRSNDAQAGPLEENPQFSSGARLATGSGPQQVLLWVALVLVVGVLAVVTLKMVRQQPAKEATHAGERRSPDGEESS